MVSPLFSLGKTTPALQRFVLFQTASAAALFCLFPKNLAALPHAAIFGNPVKQGFLIIKRAKIHPLPISRKYATIWGRLFKIAILKRAVDYWKITKILYGVILSGAAQQAFPCHPERSGVAAQSKDLY